MSQSSVAGVWEFFDAVPMWHLFFVFGVCSGALTFIVLIRRVGILGLPGFDRILLYLAIVYFCGLLGARVVSLVQWLRHPTDMEDGWTLVGPMTFYGGVMGGGIAAVWGLFSLRVRLRDVWFPFASSVCIGMAFGRVGCFLNADDYGAPIPDAAHGFWGYFAWASAGPGSVLRYPVQLTEAVFALIIWCLGLGGFLVWSHSPRNLFLLGSATFADLLLLRFFLEFYRGDPRGDFFGMPLSLSQGIALVLMCLLVWFSWKVLRVDPSGHEWREHAAQD